MVTLDGTGSSDPDGDSLTYSWRQTAGPQSGINVGQAQPTFTAPTEDLPVVLSFELVVSDGFAQSTPDTVEVTVEPQPNRAPVADAGPDQTVDEGTEVTLDATNSSDPDGNTLSYVWTQTSGPTAQLSDVGAAEPTFTAPEVESETELVFELEVDDGDKTSTDTTTVVVRDVAGDTGVGDAGAGDAGMADAATGDAGGVESDGGSDAVSGVDATGMDAGVSPPDRETDSGCGCASHQSTPPVGGMVWVLVLVGGLGAVRRRRV
jgi:MYXO-CTERM domain-containing protein